ncbi:MAG: hypothetical protein ACRDPK_05110 [Carbonactinosporaceae bacterium]
MSFATEPGRPGGPGDDFVAATATAVVVLDGVTVPEGVDTGCRHGTPWFVRCLGTRLLGRLARGTDEPLAAVLASAIRETVRLHGEGCDLTHPGTPSATVAILRERDERGDGQVDYLVLADSAVVLGLSGGVRVVLDERVERAVAEHRVTTVMHGWRLRNRPGGFWLAGTCPEAAYQSLTGQVPGADLPRAAVLTDGASRLVDRFGLVGWQALLEILEHDGPAGLLPRVRAAERAGRGYPGKRHDDATAVYCAFPAGLPAGLSAGRASPRAHQLLPDE